MEMILNTSSSQLAKRSRHALLGGVVKQARYLVPTLLVSMALTSCLGHNNSDVAYLRGINLVTNSPDLELTVDTSADVASMNYGDMSPLVGVHPGSHTVQVAAITASNLITQPQATYTPFGTALTQNFVDGSDYTVVAYGTIDNPQYLVITDTDLQVGLPADDVVYQVIHAAPKGPPVDVFITAPEAGINTPLEIGELSFGESTGEKTLVIAIPNGLLNLSATVSVNVTIELKDANTGEVLVPANTLTVNEQDRLTFVIADNIGGGSTPIVVNALDSPTGAAASGVAFANLNDDSQLAFANVTAGAPAYNVIGGLNLKTPIATNIGPGEKSGYGEVNSGVAGTIAAPTSDPTDYTFLVSFSAAADQAYTEYAVGPLQYEAGVVLQDDRRSVPATGDFTGQGEFRFLNAASTLEYGPAIDIYLNPPSVVFNIDADNTNRPPPNYAATAFKASTAYLQVQPGTYQAYFANTGTNDIVLGPVNLTIAAGDNITYVLVSRTNGLLELLPFVDASPTNTTTPAGP
jgi:hypothetical protein